MHAVRVNRLDWNLTVDGHDSCADPECFVRGDPNLKTFVFKVDEGREDPSPTLSGPSSARQRNAIKWRFAGMPMNAQHWMLASQLRFFSWSGHVLLENPIFCDFSGGGGGPNLDLHMWFHDILVLTTCVKDSDEPAQVCILNTALMVKHHRFYVEWINFVSHDWNHHLEKRPFCI